MGDTIAVRSADVGAGVADLPEPVSNADLSTEQVLNEARAYRAQMKSDVRDGQKGQFGEKAATVVGSMGKAAAGTALVGGVVAVGGSLAVANKAKHAMDRATDNIEDGLMSLLLDGMSYSSLEERVARNALDKENPKRRSVPTFSKTSSKDDGMSL